MSDLNRNFNLSEVMDMLSEVFYEGCRFTVNIANSLEEKVEEEYQAKHKKMLNTFIENIKKTVATFDKDRVRFVLNKWLEERNVSEELRKSVVDDKIFIPNNAQVERLNKVK
jgi:hypothetical protein